MIVNDLFNRSLALYDEISKTGLPDASKTADYKARCPYLVDMLQKELLNASELSKIYEIAQSPIPNMLGYISGFDIQEYKGKELIFEANNNEYGGVKAYYFEVDGPGTAYIEDYNGQWNILATINFNPATSGFTAYKGIVTPTNGATKSRIRFTGTYFYRTVNRALFNYPFAQDKVPDFKPWVKIDLPSDVKTITQVITEFPDRQYAKDSTYKIENNGNTSQLYINYYYVGKVRVQYKPVPATITSINDTIEIDDITAQAIAYGLCKWWAASEQNNYVESLCTQKFQELKAESRIKQPVTAEQIIDLYRW